MNLLCGPTDENCRTNERGVVVHSLLVLVIILLRPSFMTLLLVYNLILLRLVCGDEVGAPPLLRFH